MKPFAVQTLSAPSVSTALENLLFSTVSSQEAQMSFNTMPGFMWYIARSLVLILTVFVLPKAAEFKCPVVCDCPDETTVNCQYGYFLTNVPELPPTVRKLTIDGSKMTYLPENAFSSAHQLRALALKTSKFLTDIHPRAFYNLTNLKTLNLDRTKITQFDPSVFQPLANMSVLYIQKGKLDTFFTDGLCYMTGLSYLDLHSNQLSSIQFNPCMENLTSLAIIHLSQNPLRNMSSESFKGLKHGSIRELYLKGCNLGNLETDFFKYLYSLSKLDLRENKMSLLPVGIFENLKYLKSLFLSKNNFNDIPQEVLKPLHHLKEFYYQGNKLRQLSGLKIFQNVTTLKLFSLDFNPLISVKNSSFHYVKFLPIQHLYLRGCSLKTVEPYSLSNFHNLIELLIESNPLPPNALNNLFIGLPMQNMTLLQFNILNLEKLTNDSFNGIHGMAIEKLTLEQSKIKEIHANTFTRFPNVKILSLQNNCINSFPNGSLAGMTQLQQLWLTENELNEIPSISKTGLTKHLTRLLLSHNDIGRINAFSFENYDSLQTLIMVKNKVNFIDKNAFAHVKTLKVLNLGQNDLKSFKRNEFSHLHSLEWLNLAHNGIQYLIKDTFLALGKLQYLNLKDNFKFGTMIKTLPVLFHNLTSLRILHLENCGITSIPAFTFRNLRNLEELYLGINKISLWSPSAFAYLSKVAILRMPMNGIVIINQTSFTFLVSLRKLDLSGNPFTCTCDMVWFLPWITKKHIYLEGLGRQNFYTCKAPRKLSGTPLVNFKLTEEDCVSKLYLYLISTCSVVLVLAVVITTVLYRSRWYIRYYIYLARARKKNYRELIDQTEYVYDAFISYSSEDRSWVINDLLPELEYRRGFKLCLHHRDWLAGPDIADNIMDSVETSRRTILILSNNFLRSHWCQLEMTMAQHKLFETNQNAAVLVLLEDIDPQYLNARLRSLLTRKTYLQWTGDGNDEVKQVFWNALAEAVMQRRGENIDLIGQL